MSFPQNIRTNEITAYAEQLQSLINRKELNEKAKELGFIKKRGNLDALDFLVINLLGMQEKGQDCSLTDLCIHASTLGISIGQQSMNERFNEHSVELFKWLLKELLSQRLLQIPKMDLLKKFNGVFIEDATLFQLPDHLKEMFKGFGGDSSKAALKINCKLDLQSSIFQIRLKEGTNNDQNGLTFGCKASSLWLRDLGYYKATELINLDKQGAYFVSRLAPGSNAYLKKQGKEKVDFDYLSENLKAGQTFEQKIYVNNLQRFPCRLIVIKLPEEEIERRRKKFKKTRKAKGKKPTQNRIKLLAINIFVTNLPAQQWSERNIWYLYKIRWQIEILFKAWKSIFQLGKVKNVKKERLLTQLYIQLFQIVSTTKIFRLCKIEIWKKQGKEISELKGFKVLKGWWPKFLNAIIDLNGTLINVFLDLKKVLVNIAVKRIKPIKKWELDHICYFNT